MLDLEAGLNRMEIAADILVRLHWHDKI